MATGDKLIKLDVLKAAYDKQNSNIGPTEASSTASAAHAAGRYFIYNGTLYRATADIASGGTITPNTNCVAVTVGSETSELKSAINTIGTYDINYSYTSDGYIKLSVGIGNAVDLTPVSAGGWGYSIIDVSVGETFIITATGGGNSRAWGVIDADDELLDVANEYATLTNYILTIPENADKLIVNGQITQGIIIIKRHLVDKTYIDGKTDTNISIVWNDGAFLQANGSLNSNNSWSYSDYIEIPAPLNVHLRCQFYDSAVSLIYDKNKNVLSVISHSSSQGYVYEDDITIPVNGKFIRLSCQSSKKADAVLYLNNKQSLINISASTDVVNNNATNPIEVVNPNDGGLMKIFNDFTVVGDSLSCGSFDSKVDGGISIISKPWYSWGKYIEREAGIPVTLKAFAGATTKTWLSTYESSISTDKTKGYIIALGFNDMGESSFPLGSASDIDKNDYTQNEGSFYGNYAGIIQRIYEAQPNAKIFCMTMAKGPNSPTESLTNYCQAIRDVAEMFDCYVLDLYNNGYNYYEKAWFRDNYFRGHMLANGYIWTAWMVMQYVNAIIERNWDDFKNVQFIGSDGEWYEDN